MKSLPIVIERYTTGFYVCHGRMHITTGLDTYGEAFVNAMTARNVQEELLGRGNYSAILTHESAKDAAIAWAGNDGLSSACHVFVGDEIFAPSKPSGARIENKKEEWSHA